MRTGRLLHLVMASSILPLTILPAQEVEVKGPDVILKGIGFSLSFESHNKSAAELVVVRTAAGRELGSVELGPLATGEIRELVIDDGSALPLSVETRAASTSFSRPLLPGWVSILPPLIAIVFALVFREVVASLFAGIWLGSFFVAGYNPFSALLITIDRYAKPALADGDHASIVVFSLMLGGMVGILTRMGAARAIVDRVARFATTPRRGQLATWFAGLAIFFDDYANTLIVGNTMRPLTDRLKISREKLAYIVDSTSAPVAAIFFISTWIGYEIGLIGDALDLAARQGATPALQAELAQASPVGIFLHSIPYLYYPIAAIIMVLLIGLTKRDFGPMLKAEVRARSGRGLFREGAELASDVDKIESEPDAHPRWWFALLPISTVVVTVLVGLYATGLAGIPEGTARTLSNVINYADPFTPLLWGSLLGCLVAIGLATLSKSLSLAASVEAWIGGLKSMMLAMVILILAWSLGAVTNSLETASYLAGILSDRLPVHLLPSLVFVVSAGIAFATGTSWATMAILIPLVVPLSVALVSPLGQGDVLQHPLLLGSIASVLAGAIFGDHCSPISDTTVLSSMASGCDHVDHVRTQLPYALSAAGITVLFGTLPISYGVPPWIAMAASVAVIFAMLKLIGKDAESRRVGV